MQAGKARKTEKKENTKQVVSKINKSFGSKENNTGSPEAQIALITDRINSLTPHFQKNLKDFASRQGLLKMVGQRRKLLKYLKSKDEGRYTKLLTQLDLRK